LTKSPDWFAACSGLCFWRNATAFGIAMTLSCFHDIFDALE
jgi:hypothetical protein